MCADYEAMHFGTGRYRTENGRVLDGNSLGQVVYLNLTNNYI